MLHAWGQGWSARLHWALAFALLHPTGAIRALLPVGLERLYGSVCSTPRTIAGVSFCSKSSFGCPSGGWGQSRADCTAWESNSVVKPVCLPANQGGSASHLRTY